MASSPLTYHFDWDPVKAQTNVRGHKVTFRFATTVFRNPLALAVCDRSVCLTHGLIFGNAANKIDKSKCFHEDALAAPGRSGTTMRPA